MRCQGCAGVAPAAASLPMHRLPWLWILQPNPPIYRSLGRLKRKLIMEGQEGREWGSASKFQWRSGDGDGDGDGVAQMHWPGLALFHVAFLSHPKPRVCPTPRAQSGGQCPAPCTPQCPAMPRAVGWPFWCPRTHLHPLGAVERDQGWWRSPQRAFLGTRLGGWLSPCQGGAALRPWHVPRACRGSATATVLPSAKRPRGTGDVRADFPLGMFGLFSWVKQQHGGKNPAGRQALALAGRMATHQ